MFRTFGDGLVVKDIELLKIPTIIPSNNPNVSHLTCIYISLSACCDFSPIFP